MLYVTGIHALNLSCSLNTCGDWHTSALNWSKLDVRESSKSIFDDWGIEKARDLPDNIKMIPVANHLRAILDLMESDSLRFIKGFYNDWICTDEYNNIFFSKVILLRDKPNWNEINKLMKYEFLWDWDKFRDNS